MNRQMNCRGRLLAHFIGHKRMNSITLVFQECFSSWVKIGKLPLKNLVSSSHSPGKEHVLIIFSILLYSEPLHKANLPLWWKLFSTVWQFVTHLWSSRSLLLLSLLFRHLSSQWWTESTALSMASICPDLDASLLSQFPSILLLHINSGQDYLPACLSRCSRERGEKKERAKSLSTCQSAVRPVGWKFVLTLLYSCAMSYGYCCILYSCRKLKGTRNTGNSFLPHVLAASEK